MNDDAHQASNIKNNISLLLIIGTFVAFFVAGRFFINPDHFPKTNKGHLIIPHISINTLSVHDNQGNAYTEADTAGQWSMLYIANGDCSKRCQNALYMMRQVRIALGKDADRVRRIVIHTTPIAPSLRTFLDNTTPGMLELQANTLAVDQALAPISDSAATAGHVYLVSPDGMIFMWYPTHADVEKILEDTDHIYKDLTRTLKGSLIG